MVAFLLSLVLTASAYAGPPSSVRPSIVSWKIQEQFDNQRKTKPGQSADLACEPFWEDEAKLCFRIVRGDQREWVTQAHLVRWGVSFDGLRMHVMKNGASSIERQLKPVDVSGMEKKYWVASNEEGWASAVLLDPNLAATKLGGQTVLAAVPAHGIVIMWAGGNAEADKVIAIGVKEIFQSKPGAVSSVIYRWTGKRWAPFVEAVERGASK